MKKEKRRSDYELRHAEMESKNAPKILYLRAFDVDGDDGSNGNVSLLKLLPKELDLCEELISLPYHLVAIGRPNEVLPEIGFQRKTFSDNEWQVEVLKLMKESEMIIWRPDTSDGLFWELIKIFELNYQHKLVIWTEMGYENLLDVQKARYNAFVKKAKQELGVIFPPFDRFKKFIESKETNHWESFHFISQTQLFRRLSGNRKI